MMEILAYPPRPSWPELVKRHSRRCRSVGLNKSVIDSLLQAFTSLYQVQSRLWAIPDKAMSARGVSLTVSRTPVTTATLVIRPGMPISAVASMVCAVRAVGVSQVRYFCEEPLSPEIEYVLGSIPRAETQGLRPVTLPEEKLAGCTCIAFAADFTTDITELAHDAAAALSLGFQVVVVTNNPEIASGLPVALSKVEIDRIAIILVDAPDSINDFIGVLRPGLIVDERESARQNAVSCFVEGNLFLGPLPEVSGAEALLMLTVPIVPIHSLTETLLTIDPLLAR